MFTLDTESGFRDVVFITSSYGLGETVVQGAVNPDEFYVHKPDARRPARQAVIRRNLGSQADQDGIRRPKKRPPASSVEHRTIVEARTAHSSRPMTKK